MTRTRSANRAEGRTAKQRRTEQRKLSGKETIGYSKKTHRANRSTQRTKTLRQHGSGRRTRRTENQIGRGNGAKPKIYRGGETYAKETSSAQVWTEKGVGRFARATGKTKEQNLQAGENFKRKCRQQERPVETGLNGDEGAKRKTEIERRQKT